MLADLLMQRDDPHGEFIHLQCDGRLEARQAELLEHHSKTWLGKLGKLATRPVIRRGFVEQVSSTCINFIANGAALVKLFPLRALHITAVTRVEDIERLLAMPAMRQIRDLQLEASKALGKKHCQVLAASPILAQLERLALPGCGIGDHGAIALAGSPHLAKLPRLELRGCFIEPAGAEALGASKALPALRTLDLSHNPFSARGAHPIVHSASLTSLVDLDLSSCSLGKHGGELVAKPSARGGSLERLALQSNQLDDSVAKTFAAATHFKKLRALDLAHNAIAPALIARLAARFPG